MNCPNCGADLANNAGFCSSCGTMLPAKEPTSTAPGIIKVPEKRPMTKEELPGQFRILSPWAYFGLQILYSIPVIGFIFLIIHSFSAGNLNRRSFARSYWCALLIIGVILVVAAIIGAVLGVSIFKMVEVPRYY